MQTFFYKLNKDSFKIYKELLRIQENLKGAIRTNNLKLQNNLLKELKDNFQIESGLSFVKQDLVSLISKETFSIETKSVKNFIKDNVSILDSRKEQLLPVDIVLKLFKKTKIIFKLKDIQATIQNVAHTILPEADNVEEFIDMFKIYNSNYLKEISLFYAFLNKSVANIKEEDVFILFRI